MKTRAAHFLVGLVIIFLLSYAFSSTPMFTSSPTKATYLIEQGTHTTL